MSSYKRFDLLDPFFSTSSLYHEAALWTAAPPFFFPSAPQVMEEHYHHLDLALDLLNPRPICTPSDLPLQCPFLSPPLAIDLFDTSADLFAFERPIATAASFRRLQERAEMELYLQNLSDRVTAFDLGLGLREPPLKGGKVDRRYTWTAEVKGPRELGLDRKYKWTAEAKGSGDKAMKWAAEIKAVEDDDENGVDRKYKWLVEAKRAGGRNVEWTAEIKGKGKYAPVSQIYTWQASASAAKEEKKEKDKKKKEKKSSVHIVEVEDKNPGAIAIRKAFAKSYNKGKRKQLSPRDAAMLIQMTYRAHLVRRAQVLRCLRDLAVAKAKLKEIRTLFCNLSYRNGIAKDAEERQRFSERIIVLLLTVDAIEGPDYMVRSVKKSMVEELEAMLDIVDPQPTGKLGSMKRRRFDLPDGPVPEEMMAGVAEVVQMLDHA